jgi:hypothetical protein
MKNKAKAVMQKIELADGLTKTILLKYYQENPQRIYGVQKSLLKGHSDMPLFASSSEEKQAELFGE